MYFCAEFGCSAPDGLRGSCRQSIKHTDRNVMYNSKEMRSFVDIVQITFLKWSLASAARFCLLSSLKCTFMATRTWPPKHQSCAVARHSRACSINVLHAGGKISKSLDLIIGCWNVNRVCFSSARSFCVSGVSISLVISFSSVWDFAVSSTFCTVPTGMWFPPEISVSFSRFWWLFSCCIFFKAYTALNVLSNLFNHSLFSPPLQSVKVPLDKPLHKNAVFLRFEEQLFFRWWPARSTIIYGCRYFNHLQWKL